MVIDRLIQAIDAPDFVEQIKKPLKSFFWSSPKIREDIERINAEAGEQ